MQDSGGGKFTREQIHNLKLERRKLAETIIGRYSSNVIPVMSMGTTFSSLLLRTSITLNGGALVAMPVYFSALGRFTDTFSDDITHSAAIFVLGIITACFGAYFGYLNNIGMANSLSKQSQIEMNNMTSELFMGVDDDLVDYIKKDTDELEKKLGTKINPVSLTFWFGNIFGIISYIFFTYGCFLFREIMLSPLPS